jgi:putative membrane protein
MSRRYPAFLLTAVLLVLAWSAIRPLEFGTWVLEVAPAIAGLAVLIPTSRRFPLTPLLATLIALHMILLAVGGHYTYARVPLGDWVRDWLHLGRNHYDRLGHFAQGFVPAIITRELCVRFQLVRTPGWRAFFVVATCMLISSVYELVEWATAAAVGGAAESFLGTQGDVWDTQKDMCMALIGSVTALLLLSRWHDRQLARLPRTGVPSSEE